MDFEDLMDESECESCGGNGWECRCTPQEVEEARQQMEEAYE